MPEIVGDAGILVDPNNIDEIAFHMNRVLSDTELRKELIDKGLKRAETFSWDRAAQSLLAVLSETFGFDHLQVYHYSACVGITPLRFMS